MGHILITVSLSKASLILLFLGQSAYSGGCSEKGKPGSGLAPHEEVCSAGADIQVASWLDGTSSVKLSSLALNTAVTGEPVEVLVSVSNPLGLELSISRMKLCYEAEPASQSDAEEAPDASAAASGEAPVSASEDAPESIATVSTLPFFSKIAPQRLQGQP